jgi:predicted nucleic acid-binding protein
MKYYFLDTNVILDLVANREPFVKDAELLFKLAEEKKVRLYCSAISFNNIYYIVKKASNHQTAKRTLNLLRNQVYIIDLDKNVLYQAIDSDFKDYEDAIQYLSALTNSSIECLVTRNPKDFKLAEIPVTTPNIAAFNVLNQ